MKIEKRIDQHAAEIERGERFKFGRNWTRFLATVNERRIALAEQSLRNMLGETSLDGKTFLDIGSGSGLFSLAARRLGARVVSFDYDPESVACTAAMREQFFPRTSDWVVGRGSVLDRDYLARLGTFDIVYSWGVLHHTGAMWQAFENVKPLVKEDGKLFIAIYNDLGCVTDRWEAVKRKYNALPRVLAWPYALSIVAREEWPQLRQALLLGRPGAWLDQWRNYAEQSRRGMSRWHDWIDWIGGYPYERATVEQVVDCFSRDGFSLIKLVDCSGGYGCNEFVFTRVAPPGTWIENRIPGGTSFLRRYGWRVVGPIVERANGFFGTVPSMAGRAPRAEWALFRNGALVGPTEMDGDSFWKVAPVSDPPCREDVFHVAPARIVYPREPFAHVRGRMWSWSAPDLEGIADNVEPSNHSPVFVFEDGVQLPFPHALHEDIAKEGQGRFSHWGRYVYFSTLSDKDPNDGRTRFKLVIATDDWPVLGEKA